MNKYKVLALDDLEAEFNSWTKGLDYEVIETETKFQITSNEGQVAYVSSLKEDIMINFEIA
jgi:hypothetical protein